MAKSWQTETSAAGQVTVGINIPYMQRSHIYLYVDGSQVTGFTWESDVLIRLPAPLFGGQEILVMRRTERDNLVIQFSEGAAFDRSNLDEQNTQFLYLSQELVEGRSIEGFYGDISMNTFRITNLGKPIYGTDAANKAYVDAEVQEVNQKAIRVPEATVAAAPTISGRRNKLLGFDSIGNPVSATPIEGSATELELEMKDIDGFSMLGRAPSVADLRLIEPQKDRCLVSVESHTAGTGFGGGMFEYLAKDKTTADDGGFVIVGANGSRWRRVIDMEQLDVTHWGAVPGKSDSIEAVKAMYAWLASAGDAPRRIGIRFPAGEFSISNWDISNREIGYFHMHGASSGDYGYMAGTKLTLLGAAGTYAITVKARRTEISGFNFYGQFDVDGVKRNFFKNTVAEGAYVRLHNFLASYIGICFWMQDTLDAKFDQFYTSRTQDNVFRVVASNIKSWTHSTAVELSNFNIQYHEGKSDQESALFIPNCAQSLIWNGWIEHSTYPGNLTRGQWNIQSFSLESTTYPLYLKATRFLSFLHSNPNGAGFDYTTDRTCDAFGNYETRDISAYEKGYVRMNTYGVIYDTTTRTQMEVTYQKYSNITGNATWVRLGHMFSPELAQITKIRAVGRGSYNTASNVASVVANAEIAIQNRSAVGGTVSWQCDPLNTPVLDVKYTQLYVRDVDVYVLVPPYSQVGFAVETNGPDRYQAGSPTGFTWDMSPVDINTVQGLMDAPEVKSVGTQATNLRFEESGNVFLKAPIKTVGEMDVLDLRINGRETTVPFMQPGAQTQKIPVYYYSGLPAASANFWGMCILRGPFVCSDGEVYQTQPVWSDGTNWHPMQKANTSVTGPFGG